MINKKAVGRVTLDKFFVYLLCVLLLLSQSIFFLAKQESYLEIIIIFVVMLLSLLSIFANRQRNNLKIVLNFSVIFVFQIALFFISTYVYTATRKSFLLIFLCIPFLYLYFSANSLEKNTVSYLLSTLSKLITILATFSIFMWLTCSVLKLLSPSSYTLLNWGVPHYIPSFYNLYFETQKVNLGSLEFMRNTFIYPEGPIYSFVLSFALIFSVFIKEKKLSSFTALVLMMSILTTGSSTGFIVIAGVIFLKKVIDVKDKKLSMVILFIAVLILCVVAIMVIFQKQEDNGNSLNVRLEDISIGFNIWFQHFLTGVGYGNYSEILSHMNLRRLSFNGNTGFSSGLALIAAYGGVPLLMNYLLPIFNGVKVGMKRGIKYLIFSLLILFLLVTTIVQVNYIILTSLVYLLTINDKKETFKCKNI